MLLKDIHEELSSSMPEHDARYVIEKRAGLSHTEIIANPDRDIDETAILEDLERHHNGEPLSRIYNEREFYGLSFKLSPETLDPRPDTETLIDAVLERYKDSSPKTILDLGTGTGCILITLLKHFPDAKGVGVDLSEDALETAQTNAKTHKVDDRATFIQSNWTESIHESFDLVVSNPPYIDEKAIQNLDESVKNHDPILALQGGKDGLQAYREIFSNLFSLLNKGGRAFFEIGFDQEKSTRRLVVESRLLLESAYADLAGHIRVIEVLPDKTSGDK